MAVGALLKFEIGITFLFLAACLFTVDHNNFIYSEKDIKFKDVQFHLSLNRFPDAERTKCYFIDAFV